MIGVALNLVAIGCGAGVLIGMLVLAIYTPSLHKYLSYRPITAIYTVISMLLSAVSLGYSRRLLRRCFRA